MRGAWLDECDGTDPDADAIVAPEADEPRRGTWLPAPRAQDRDGRLLLSETPGWATALTVIGALALGIMIFAALSNNDNELVTGAVVGLVLAVVSVVGFRFIARHDANPPVASLLSAALSVKIIATWARYQVGSSVYERSDANNYDTYGRQWAGQYLSNGRLPPGVKNWSGTNFIRLVVAEVYNLVGPSKFAGFIVFSWIGFLGLVLFWRAFRRVYPNGERTYFHLVMFAPSLAYWPSSIGKEAIVIFGVGLATYGFARTLTRSVLVGTALVGAGIVLVTYVRAHVALTVLIGMFSASLLRKRARGQLIAGLVSIVAFGFVAVYVAQQANTYFKTNVSDASQLSDTLSNAVDRTSTGNSEFTPVPIQSPADFPYAAVTVLFRPFPWESGSPQEQLTSLESLAYAAALVFAGHRVFTRVRRDQPMALYAVTTTIVFIVLFSNFANFGILARQRTQVLPFLFVLLCLPPRPPKERYVPMMQRVLAAHSPGLPSSRAGVVARPAEPAR